MKQLSAGRTPLDLRLVPGAVGTWAVCALAVATPHAGYALGGVAALGVAAAGWPRRGAQHRTSWRGWASLMLALGCAVALAAGGAAAAQVAHRAKLNDAVLEFADPQSYFQVRLTSEVTPGASGAGARAQLIAVGAGALVPGAGPPAGQELPPAGQELRASVPIYLVGVRAQQRVGQRLTVTGRVFEGDEHRLVMMVTDTLSSTGPGGVLRGIDRMRAGVRSATARLPPQARGLIPGVAIGDDRDLPGHVREAMRTTSLTHVTAVSGAHVAVVMGTILFLLTPAPAGVRSLLAALTLAAMVALVLPSPSVLRAAGMGVITLIALASGRPRLAVPLLSATVTALLAYDPWLATSIGFALSVSATSGIVLWSEPISRLLGGSALARAAAVPAAAQAWCAPLLLTFDSNLATYAIPANLFAVPALAPATILGLTSALASLLSPGLAAVIAGCASYFTGWIAAVAVFFADLPGAKVPWPGGAAGAIALSVLTTVVAVELWRRADPGGTWQA